MLYRKSWCWIQLLYQEGRFNYTLLLWLFVLHLLRLYIFQLRLAWFFKGLTLYGCNIQRSISLSSFRFFLLRDLFSYFFLFHLSLRFCHDRRRCGVTWRKRGKGGFVGGSSFCGLGAFFESFGRPPFFLSEAEEAGGGGVGESKTGGGESNTDGESGIIGGGEKVIDGDDG